MNIFKQSVELFNAWLPVIFAAVAGYIAFLGSKIEGKDISLAQTLSLTVMGIGLIIVIMMLVWIDVRFKIEDIRRGN